MRNCRNLKSSLAAFGTGVCAAGITNILYCRIKISSVRNFSGIGMEVHMKTTNKEEFEKQNVFGMGNANTAYAQYFSGESF